MYKLPYQALLRQSLPRSSSYYATPRMSRRLLSTTPPASKSRSWKSSAARWVLAIGGVYYYNTSDVFAEAPKLVSAKTNVVPGDDSDLPTLESVSERRKAAFSTSKDGKEEQSITTDATSTVQEIEEGIDSGEDVEGIEEEAGREGAFNPETGEINWDCPCLGGMAHGPCGPEFRAAFSCFVYSQEEPKGMDCIEKFKGMQDCFRQHPDVYGEELDEEEDEQRENNAGVVQADKDSNPSPILLSTTSASPRSNPQPESIPPEKAADTHSLPAASGSEQEASSEKASATAAPEDRKGIDPKSEGSLVPKDGFDVKKDNDDK